MLGLFGRSDRSSAMLTRRALMASSAALAAGCSSLQSSFSPPALPKDVELTWGALNFSAFYGRGPERTKPETRILQIAAGLEEDTENPNGPHKGRYTLAPTYIRMEDVEPQPRNLDEYLAWFGSLEIDLITVGPRLAQVLGERGIILPLDPLIAADDPGLVEAFYPYLLDHLRLDAGLFGLPVDANPVMLHYHPAYFAERGVSLVHENWDWDDLKESAIKLTQRDEEGEVQRWGLALMSYGYWWALWQNGADLADPTTLRCLLQEPAAAEALQFCHDLIHKHRVAPPVTHMDPLRLLPSSSGRFPAMEYSAYQGRWSLDYSWAEIPQGKVRSVPVSGDMGIGIMARTENTEGAYTALKGLVNVMQRFVPVPAQKEAVARLGDFRKTILPAEVAAIQTSMQHGRGIPLDQELRGAMRALEEGIVRGDDVLTVIDEACTLIEA